jgi:hypothetical protein
MVPVLVSVMPDTLNSEVLKNWAVLLAWKVILLFVVRLVVQFVTQEHIPFLQVENVRSADMAQLPQSMAQLVVRNVLLDTMLLN